MSYKKRKRKKAKAKAVKREFNIKFNAEAWLKMRQLIAMSETEVGWNGIVERIDSDNFYVADTLLYPQKVSSVTVRSDDIEHALWEFDKGADVLKRIRLFGHSHVNMSPTPSSYDLEIQDEKIETLTEEGDFYIYLIINKSLQYTAKVVVVENGEQKIYKTDSINIQVVFNDGTTMKEFTDSYYKYVKKEI